VTTCVIGDTSVARQRRNGRPRALNPSSRHLGVLPHTLGSLYPLGRAPWHGQRFFTPMRPCAPMQCRALAQPQRSDRWAHGCGTPATAGQYPILTAHAQGSGVPFHQAPLRGSNCAQTKCMRPYSPAVFLYSLGWSLTALPAPGHNSLLPWSPDVLKTPTDAEWSQLSIPRGRGPIGRGFIFIDLVTLSVTATWRSCYRPRSMITSRQRRCPSPSTNFVQ
jgi:hypothetical protein